MRSAFRPLVVAFFCLATPLAACTPGAPVEEPPAARGSGGAATPPQETGGSAPSGSGGAASAPASGGGPGPGSASGGGSGSGGAVSAPGGSGSGGAPASASDAGATDSAIGVDTGSGPPAAGSGRPPKPSAGCGKMPPAAGTRMVMSGGKPARFIVTVPADYDPNKPWPLGFAFHGYNLQETSCSGGCSGFKDLKAITVYPKSIGPGWEYPVNLLAPNIKFFEELVDLMKSEYCIDENRILVAGVSSGGQFVEHLACKHGDWLWAVSPVAAYVDKGVDMACKGTPPQIIIHGVTDRAGNYGQSVAELYAKRNGCTMAPTAGIMQARTEMMAAFNARRAEFRCVNWDGCTANPVRYCIFSQITYNNLTHGWPRVGGMLINEFLGTLKN